jgi:hypothetical protein
VSEARKWSEFSFVEQWLLKAARQIDADLCTRMGGNPHPRRAEACHTFVYAYGPEYSAARAHDAAKGGA